MKKWIVLLIAVLAMTMLAVSACSKTSLVMNSVSEKEMTVEVNKAAEGDFAMAGSLEVAEGEQVKMTANLEKGEVLIELYGTPAEQSSEEIPDMSDGEPVMTFNASGADTLSGTLPEGSYMVKATVSVKATGTVTLEVTDADSN